MPELINKDNNQKEKLNFFDYLMEFIGWIQIVASPLIGGIIVGGIVYLLIGNTPGLIIGIVVATIGLLKKYNIFLRLTDFIIYKKNFHV